ncbi:hypothetical protein VDQ11_21950, partial [Xanthomonas campestris pv. campestris]|nr:hypothetical protein [Xanthomonas campestris pv. campestris]MEB1270893.1 hypothetical protein [Xanthomonas campestris pv. campestris]MEB1283364.1 hypothetical protein [Xanthomonas campestris pv. campestris]MEB1345772.1 hypothetical protein [Xanthomonas campestris pv. campestris]
HARTFFQAITSQVIDLPGGNVGKPQVLDPESKNAVAKHSQSMAVVSNQPLAVYVNNLSTGRICICRSTISKSMVTYSKQPNAPKF